MSAREGSRGGRFRSLEDAQVVQSIAPDAERAGTAIRQVILEALRRGEYHADDLAEISDIVAAYPNAVGGVVGGLLKKEEIVEVGRKAATEVASHRRKSGVYRFTELGRERHAGVDAEDVEGHPSVDPGVPTGAGVGAGEPAKPEKKEGSSLSHISPDPGSRTARADAIGLGSRPHFEDEDGSAGAIEEPAEPDSLDEIHEIEIAQLLDWGPSTGTDDLPWGGYDLDQREAA